MRAVIVDDVKQDTEQVLNYLEQFGREQDIEIDIKCFDNAGHFLEQFDQIKPELVIMDIDMPEINGMEAAQKMRGMDERAVLLFVTNMKHYAIQGYSVDALDYLIKPLVYEEFVLRLQKARRYILQNRDDEMILHIPGGMIKVPISEIYFVESVLHYLIFHSKTGDYKVRDSMTRTEKYLRSYAFASCNKSFLVNLRYVEAMDRENVTVAGTVLKMSRGKKAEFISRYTKYLGGMKL